MYSVMEILNAAKIGSVVATVNKVQFPTIRMTDGNQLIGTYAELTKFRAANYSQYKGWDVHHILESQDVKRLQLTPFSPSRDDQICVLIPYDSAHKMISKLLRDANQANLSVQLSELRGDYRDAYNEVQNYCGSSQLIVDTELYAIFTAVINNLVALQDKALAKVQSELQSSLNLLALQKGLHSRLIKGSSPGVLKTAGMVASFINPITAGMALVNPANQEVFGAFVNLFNPDARPDITLWNKAEAHAAASIQGLRDRDLERAATELLRFQIQFKKADLVFNSWRDKIDLAGRRAQLGIAAAAVAATVVLVGVFILEGAGAGATAAAAGGATTDAATVEAVNVKVRVATGEVIRGARIAMEAQSLAQEEAGEEIAVEGMKMVLRLGE